MTEPPPLTDLVGMDPDLTGGLSPDEYLRQIRGECRSDADEEEDEAGRVLRECQIDVYRPAVPGPATVTVRLTHLPTGVSAAVEAQEGNQRQAKAEALAQLVGELRERQ